MSPNQPKTPISSFRLSQETKCALAEFGERWETTMTGAIERMTTAIREASSGMAEVGEVAERATRYPFEAHFAAVMAYRIHMGLGAGDRLPDDVIPMVDAVVRAASPIIREAQYVETMRDVINRLEVWSVDPDVVDHFRSQIPEREK